MGKWGKSMKVTIAIPKKWRELLPEETLQQDDHYLTKKKGNLYWEPIARRLWGCSAGIIGGVIRKSN